MEKNKKQSRAITESLMVEKIITDRVASLFFPFLSALKTSVIHLKIARFAVKEMRPRPLREAR